MILELEKLVTSQELSSDLKSLGFPQETVFYWWRPHGIEAKWKLEYLTPERKKQLIEGYNDLVAAPTSGEIGELLRKWNKPLPIPFALWDYDWTFNLTGQAEGYGTEAEARGLMWKCLRERRLV